MTWITILVSLPLSLDRCSKGQHVSKTMTNSDSPKSQHVALTKVCAEMLGSKTGPWIITEVPDPGYWIRQGPK